MKKRYFKGIEIKIGVRNIPAFELKHEIRKKVQFVKHNLLSPFYHRDIDVIFLRNVMIYFNHESKQKVMMHVQNTLRKGGYLFISVSETLNDVSVDMNFVKYGIYEKI